MAGRVPFDADAYERRIRAGCYICAFVRGEPDYQEFTVYADADHIAYLDRYPTLFGKVLVAPKAHREHVVRDFAEPEYLALMAVVRRVALGVEAVLTPERTYLLSLGSQQGNSHVHWHIAPLPAGVPFREQQLRALAAENGVLDLSPDERADLAGRIRVAIAA